MRKKMRSIRKLANQSAFSNRVRLNVNVHFDLEEPQNLVDGIPNLKFSLGSFRSQDKTASLFPPPSRARTTHAVAGGDIQTTLRLSGPSAFTFMSVIKEIRINKADIPA
ncbi:MAG: hypothetical protein ABSG96_09065 [Terracidiphilus sp.]|jgi:hypothetical protein